MKIIIAASLVLLMSTQVTVADTCRTYAAPDGVLATVHEDYFDIPRAAEQVGYYRMDCPDMMCFIQAETEDEAEGQQPDIRISEMTDD